MIRDGFGDHDLEDAGARCQEFIESPWVDKLVHAMLYDHSQDEDYAQEARLAMWQAAGSWDGKGSLEGYLHQKARWKILSLLSGNHRFTGQERVRAVSQRRGDESRERLRSAMSAFKAKQGRDPTVTEMAHELGIHPATVRKQMRTHLTTREDVRTHVQSLDALIEAYGTDAVVGVAEKFDAILLAYHYGEIHQAISELEPLWREYVYLRFWQGYGDLQTARVLGCRVHWHDRIRPQLAEKLAHLATAI